MSFLELIRFSLKSLTVNRLRSVLTTLGIVIGVMSVIVLIAVGNGSAKAVQSSLDRLGTNSIQLRSGGGNFGGGGFQAARSRANSGNTRALSINDALALTDANLAPDIKQVAPVVNANATCVNGSSTTTPATFVGTWPTYFEAANEKVSNGSYFSDEDVSQARRIAVIGQTTQTELFGNENAIGQVIRCGGIPFTIVGIADKKGATGFQDGDSIFIAPISAIQSSLTGFSNINSIIIEAKNSKVTDLVQSEIESVMDVRHHITNPNSRDYQLFNQASLLTTAASNNRVFTVLLGAVAAISLLVGGIGITNIMLVTVVERTREIGIRKAIGAPKKIILLQFLVEATILSLIGGILGVVGGFLGSMFTIVGVKPVIVPASVVLAFLLSIAIGIDRKSTRLNSSHSQQSRMPSSA